MTSFRVLAIAVLAVGIYAGCSSGDPSGPGTSTPTDMAPASPDPSDDTNDPDDPPIANMSDAGTIEPEDPASPPGDEEDTEPLEPGRMCSADETQYVRDNATLLADLTLQCGLGCVMGDDLSGCFTVCAEDEVPALSGGCLSCLGSLLECVVDEGCTVPCIGGLEAPTCRTCLCESNCLGPYDTCAGTESAVEC